MSCTNQQKAIQNYGITVTLYSTFYCESCIRGKAITAPKTETITTISQKGTRFFSLFSPWTSAIGLLILFTGKFLHDPSYLLFSHER
uniref:Uncharacterized protein n=1 Tax=Triticum urartu TaxID=4572 RepID=A0A8R7QZZ2_TRIUA